MGAQIEHSAFILHKVSIAPESGRLGLSCRLHMAHGAMLLIDHLFRVDHEKRTNLLATAPRQIEKLILDHIVQSRHFAADVPRFTLGLSRIGKLWLNIKALNRLFLIGIIGRQNNRKLLLLDLTQVQKTAVAAFGSTEGIFINTK